VRLWSRNGRDWSAEFVAVTAAAMALQFHRIVLDGEAVAHCPEGLPDFASPRRSGCARACFYALDLPDDFRRSARFANNWATA
jgi:ATP-dependent DNA ligase